jgi:DNA-binding response OmpR family regulator
MCALVSSNEIADSTLVDRQVERTSGKTLIAIVEDDRGSAQALRSIFMRKGCEVIVASTMEHGMLLLDRTPNYLLLDLNLPDGDGIEILRRIKAEEKAIRVVVTTATGDARRLADVQALRPHRILRKPLDLIDLLSAIGMM